MSSKVSKVSKVSSRASRTTSRTTLTSYLLTILTYSQGYVLKPLGMRISEPDWPPASLTLTRVTLEILSLHGLPRPTESRPCLEGRHARCHQYAPQLSGD